MVRVSPTASLADDLDRVATWIETLTGLTLDETGGVQVLGSAEWLERRQKLQQQGGPPVREAGSSHATARSGPEAPASARAGVTSEP